MLESDSDSSYILHRKLNNQIGLLFLSKHKITLFHRISHSYLFVTRHLSLIVIFCYSLSFVVTRCHSLFFAVTCLTTSCHSLYHSLSLVVIRCHSMYPSSVFLLIIVLHIVTFNGRHSNNSLR